MCSFHVTLVLLLVCSVVVVVSFTLDLGLALHDLNTTVH